MALPKLNDKPKYELTVPSTGTKIRFRPYLVKEEKILMLAMESEDKKATVNAIVDTIMACVDGDEIDENKLTSFDVEYMFLNIRAKSVGEVSKLRVLCQDDGKTYANVEIDLNEIQVTVNDEHTNKIELTDEMGVIMKYPSIDSFSKNEISDVSSVLILEEVET